MNTIKVMKNGRPATHKELCAAAGIPEHTRGSWRAIAPGVDHTVGMDKRIMVLHPDGERLVCCLDVGWKGSEGIISEPERIANARLIAAAPELLESLRECRAALVDLIAKKPGIQSLLCGSTTIGNLRVELGGTIKKATGGTA